MTVVSNTSPLRYLIAAGLADLLAKLFGTILIPGAVEREILDPHAPHSVRHWMTQRPAWLQVREVQTAPDVELTQHQSARTGNSGPLVIRVLATCWESSVGAYILASHKAKREIPTRCRPGGGQNVTLD